MNTQPIHTETNYKAALKIASKLIDLDPEQGTPEADQLEVLGLLVMAYEASDGPQP